MIKAPTDAVLVTKSVAGDKDSYRTLVERYQQRVFAIAFDIVRVREDAEDIAQEAFVKAFISLADFKGQSSFYTWLYRIVHNMAIDYRRRVSRRGGAPAEFNEQLHAVEGVESSGHFDSPDQAIMRKEQAVSINAVLAELSEEHRIVVTLREIDGLSYDEIADVLGISRGTVMSRLHYGRKRLQAALVERGMRDAVVPNPDQVSEQQLSGLR